MLSVSQSVKDTCISTSLRIEDACNFFVTLIKLRLQSKKLQYTISLCYEIIYGSMAAMLGPCTKIQESIDRFFRGNLLARRTMYLLKIVLTFSSNNNC